MVTTRGMYFPMPPQGRTSAGLGSCASRNGGADIAANSMRLTPGQFWQPRLAMTITHHCQAQDYCCLVVTSVAFFAMTDYPQARTRGLGPFLPYICLLMTVSSQSRRPCHITIFGLLVCVSIRNGRPIATLVFAYALPSPKAMGVGTFFVPVSLLYA